VLQGSVSTVSSVEQEVFTAGEWGAGWRRACQTFPGSDCRLDVPPSSLLAQPQTQVAGEERPVPLEPAVRGYVLPPWIPDIPTPEDVRARVLDSLAARHGIRPRLDAGIAESFSRSLRQLEGQTQAVVHGEEVVALLPAQRSLLGLAVDLGTTKVAAYLVDLTSGNLLAARGEANPQIAHGDDVISRLSHAMTSPRAARELQQAAVETVAGLATALCREVGADPGEIVDAALVGNTAMHHLLLGLPVEQLARAPYIPARTEPVDCKAGELGLGFAPGANLHILANIGGFVGGDHTALLTVWADRDSSETTLYLDFGTNTEASLLHEGRIRSVSCASGPAFEGGRIKDGMRAAGGAIESVWFIAGIPHYQTICSEPPIGICGSGILDAVAQLCREGVVTSQGRMLADHPRIRKQDGVTEFILVAEDEKDRPPAIGITQRDIRELQLAKAAVRSGIEVLLKTAGIRAADVDQMILAGAFGSYFDPRSAQALGMLPVIPLAQIRQVGNAAGIGAKQALLSRSAREAARTIASQALYVELANDPDFNQIFTASIPFDGPR
jgi:uncharacterized 2Fe-2S/4Fe-4S cluster protein (DUF4445 family)